MIEAIQNHASDLISALAVILAAAANWRVVRSERRAQQAEKALRRTEMLVEIEQKNATVGKLALVTVQKILLLQRHPHLVEAADGEIERLRNNLGLLEDFKNREEEQRRVSEAAGGGGSIELHHQALADIRRLRVSMEAEVEKEAQVYRELVEESRHHAA